LDDHMTGWAFLLISAGWTAIGMVIAALTCRRGGLFGWLVIRIRFGPLIPPIAVDDVWERRTTERHGDRPLSCPASRACSPPTWDRRKLPPRRLAGMSRYL
jgi:hypothetical protein